MSFQLSTGVRNAELDAIETTIGTSAKLMIYTGSQPANCAAASTGTLLATLTLPSDWMATASGGTKAIAGTWTGQAGASGNAGYFRVTDNAGTTCHIQGDITATGGGGTMTMDNINIATNQNITVNSFTLTAGNS